MSTSPIEKRFEALIELLGSEKSTKSAVPFSEWNTKPVINFEDNIIEELFIDMIID
jgi:hypothetical protein